MISVFGLICSSCRCFRFKFCYLAALSKHVFRLHIFDVYALELIFGLSILNQGMCAVGLMFCYVFYLRLTSCFTQVLSKIFVAAKRSCRRAGRHALASAPRTGDASTAGDRTQAVLSLVFEQHCQCLRTRIYQTVRTVLRNIQDISRHVNTFSLALSARSYTPYSSR